MRITKISVKGLFGMFDHEIPLNQESQITIVHGPNGVGKTVTLRLVHSLFNYGYTLVAQTRFERLHIEFEGNDESIVVEKIAEEKGLSISYNDGTGTDFTPFEPVVLTLDGLIAAVKEHFPHLALLKWDGKPYWNDVSTLETMQNHNYLPIEECHNIESIFARYPKFDTAVHGDKPAWFVRAQKNTSTEFMGTERLLGGFFFDIDLEGIMWEDVADSAHLSNPEPAVYDFSLYFRPIVDDFFALTADLEKLRELSKRYNELNTILPAIERRVRQDETFQKVTFFRDEIGKRILFKSLELDADNGFKFVSDDGSEVPLSALSSGEQHLLILYYQLLFKIEPDTLVMIDEPELSMNVVWQRNFLKDLQRIIELRKFDVLIATHSPQIIHDKWDWMVPLGEKVDD